MFLIACFEVLGELTRLGFELGDVVSFQSADLQDLHFFVLSKELSKKRLNLGEFLGSECMEVGLVGSEDEGLISKEREQRAEELQLRLQVLTAVLTGVHEVDDHCVQVS